MPQISFKIPAAEHDFLKWYSERTAGSVSTIYREATMETFRTWKMDILCELYAKGSISFKQLCNIGNISFLEGMLLIEQKEIEPPIPESVDEYTTMIRKKYE